jgi:YidC/Oxa1 family membrane protein insertase
MILANVIESAFGPLISFFQAILVAVHSVIGGSYGWSIIGLTLLVRTVTMPLTIRQFKGMAQLRAHAPELAKIKQRYPDDRQRQQEETMKYYKEAGVNPLASCLPLVLQIPVFISLVYMLRTDLKKHLCGAALKAAHITSSSAIGKANCNKLTHSHVASFLFINDITAKATGIVLIVLMVLYVGTMVTTSVMMSVGSDRNQRLMSIALPVVFVVFVIQFPAGLLVYWIATNFTMIPQQYYLLRRYGRPSGVPIKVETNGRGSAGAAKEAVRVPARPAPTPPKARAAQRRKRSGRRR